MGQPVELPDPKNASLGRSLGASQRERSSRLCDSEGTRDNDKIADADNTGLALLKPWKKEKDMVGRQ